MRQAGNKTNRADYIPDGLADLLVCCIIMAYNELPRGIAPKCQMEFINSDPESRGIEPAKRVRSAKPITRREVFSGKIGEANHPTRSFLG